MNNLDQLNSEAPIIKHTLDLYKQFYEYSKSFPKKDQYMLGRRCEDYLLNFTELVLVAVGSPKEQKLKTLEQANAKFEVIKVFFRIAREFKIIDNKKYLVLETQAQEIGKMLGGWIRSLKY